MCRGYVASLIVRLSDKTLRRTNIAITVHVQHSTNTRNERTKKGAAKRHSLIIKTYELIQGVIHQSTVEYCNLKSFFFYFERSVPCNYFSINPPVPTTFPTK